MKFAFSPQPLSSARKGYVRLRLTEESKETRRFVREGGHDWLEIGTGPHEEVSRRKFFVICRAILAAAKQHNINKLALHFDNAPFPQLRDISLREVGQQIAENMVMAGYSFRAFKTKPKEGWHEVEEVLICGETPLEMREGFARGVVVGEAVNLARSLANTPGGDMTPRALAQAAKNAVRGTKAVVRVLSLSEIKKLGMGGLLGVAKGSVEPPTFTIMEYKGAKEAPIVLVGKGITFDTGGINIKSETGVSDMHMDMSGGAAVIAAVSAAARLGLKRHVIGLIPAAENMPSGTAFRPHDVLRSLSGKTIEVGNTDAEGRLILADALTYAKRFKPSLVVDVATLTGAAMSALGLHASALLTRDDALAHKLLELGEASGDYLWRLPLWDEYEEGLKSEIADINNVPGSGPSARYGGAINGGIFLWQFAKELSCPWAHLDIAPRMTTIPSDELAKGAAGAPVRLLIRLIEQWTA
jgi:leucyl aminopeptidase